MPSELPEVIRRRGKDLPADRLAVFAGDPGQVANHGRVPLSIGKEIRILVPDGPDDRLGLFFP